ncbi:MAG: Crp/Fnr family transcriptional regulator [Rhodospirillaceae bacterium]|jgi:CRP/FNR family transcriptional regulator, polysaccharide utilization system transcription regulator|nr:Crp/Fnr family transcriptional regulator [Rhodospirillaceae bacterium]MBT7354875.1 Crp/Fnr family transcriptional regulator [Rhodospirillaceae bacterium]
MSESGSHSKCNACPTRQNTEWKDLSEEELDLIDRFKRVSDREPGEIIYQQGDQSEGVYCIQSGLVGIRQLDADGKETLLRLCNPGETIGYRALLSNSEHSHYAEILAPSHICFIERRIVTDLLSHNPVIGERFLVRSLNELNEAEENLVRSRNLKVRTRLLHCLMVLFDQYGDGNDQKGYVLKIPVSRKDLASLITVTPESVSRTINNLEEDNLVHFEGRNAHFMNIDAIFDEIGAVH